jgi:hypothetical protein
MQPTQKNNGQNKKEYCKGQEVVIITYHASKMILAVHNNPGYCNNKKSDIHDKKFSPNNGSIMNHAIGNYD